MTIVKNYGQSKIYKLYSECSDLYYIGSTTIRDIKQRLSKHKTEAKNNIKSVLSKFILDQDSKALQIETIYEYVDFTTDDELQQAKKEYLEQIPESDRINCINFMKSYNYGEKVAGRKLRGNKKELVKIKKRVEKLIKEADSSEDESSSSD